MLVTIITPCRNEAGYIDTFVQSALGQQTGAFSLELIIAEGASDDGTVARLATLCAQHPELRVIENPQRIVSTGLNRAIGAARGDIIVRMDVHTEYDADYVMECVAALQSSGAACVGGPWRASGDGVKQQAIADAFQAPLGSGGAASRRLDYDGPCDTVYLGCWWKHELIAVGGFDEALVRNQDDELCLRLKLGNRAIWQSSRIRSRYTPRASFRALWHQFFQYGYWKVAVAKKHGQHAALRHLAPVMFVGGLAVLFVAGWFVPMVHLFGAAVLAIYAIAVGIAAVQASARRTALSVAYVALAIILMHFGYGVGYGLGIKDFTLVGKGARSNMSVLTR